LRRSGGLLLAATIGWLVVLGGLAAFVGGIGPAATPTLPPGGATGAIGSGAATATAGSSPSGDSSSAPSSQLASQPPSQPASQPPSPSPELSVTLVGAGDIADCDLDGDTATAKIVAGIPGTVFTAGDNAYEDGTARQFRECFDPTWGRFKGRIRPAPGNHDWQTDGAAGYRGYFGDVATNADGRTWYSYELGAWHIIVLDSQCADVKGCGASSEQGRWLAADLAGSRARCTLAIWHIPRFSSGEHGSDPATKPFWEALVAAGADIVVNGHDHDYERFAPQDANANPRDDGIREFVVGTGGAGLRGFRKDIAPNSLVRSSIAHGVLELTLRPSDYSWQFHSTDGSFSDQGSAICH
jgi:hypothetical protein